MQDDDLYKLLLSTKSTTVRPRPPKDDIELDDQAPLALVICIAAPVFIGFVILVLIYCFCRRRPNNASGSQNSTGNTAAYHRAPEVDGTGMGGVGVGVGGSYPMTAVTTPYPGGFQPGLNPPSSQAYRMPLPVAPSPLPSYPNQQVPVPPPPRFGGVPATYPPPPHHQYPPSVYLPPPSHPHPHAHSLSHSSQASSASATTAEPCAPSSPPQHHHPLLQQHQQFQHPQYIQQHFYPHHPHQPPQLHQIHGLSGRDSPAAMHLYTSQPSSAYPLVQSADPSLTAALSEPKSAPLSPVSSLVEGKELTKAKTQSSDNTSPSALLPPQIAEQDLGYSDEEE